MITLQKNNWIGKPIVESVFILCVPFLCVIALLFIPKEIIHANEIPEIAWLFLVVFVDVGHVYSTMYRTYMDKELIYKHQNLFIGLPVLLFVLSVLLHSINSVLFWRCLAYFAVFHFIKQQYGFFKIYNRNNNNSTIKNYIDTTTIYGATLLPIVYWHFSPNRNFNWFIKDDFVLMSQSFNAGFFIECALAVLITLYVISELILTIKNKTFNIQKNAIVIGTAFSWYFGIVFFNSDFVFTFLNVICHGIPYMALIWIHGKKNRDHSSSKTAFLKAAFGKYSAAFFLIPIIILAYVEETFWDVFVWNEHQNLFMSFSSVEQSLSKNVLNIIVPLLSLPQLFHYVIDGFIWKIKHDKFNWTNIFK